MGVSLIVRRVDRGAQVVKVFRLAQETPVSILSRHFTFSHPLFRKERTHHGVRWRESVYFLWWEFLRRHEGYRRECERGGGGKYAKLYADFGDVHRSDFRTWWRTGDRGARLFAEPATVPEVRVVYPHDLVELSDGWDERGMVLIAVPLAFPKRYAVRKIAKLIARRVPFRKSRALYPVVTQVNHHSLETALRVYDLRTGRPEMTLWEIAEEVKLGRRMTKEELNAPRGSPGRVSAQAALAVAASRKFTMAKRIIEGVARGIFPALGPGERR
jgi:hypothetical protein